MDESHDPGGFLSGVDVECCHQALTDLPLRVGDRPAVAIREPRVQRGDQRLVHRRLPIEPFGVGEGLAADQWRVQTAELGQREGGVGDAGPTDLVAHLRRRGIIE